MIYLVANDRNYGSGFQIAGAYSTLAAAKKRLAYCEKVCPSGDTDDGSVDSWHIYRALAEPPNSEIKECSDIVL